MPSARLIAELLLARGRTFSYGQHRSQRADLHVPRGEGPHTPVVLIHGGSWRKGYGRIVMRGLAADLVRRGLAVWNIGYRRLGEGGGWPHTFADVASAIDYLVDLDAPLTLAETTLVGHSAGGQLALWAAGRGKLAQEGAQAPGGSPRTPVARVAALAGVCDLAGAYREWHGGSARALMGGSPQALPERYALGDPLANVPLELPVLLVHGTADATVSVRQSRAYARAATQAGGQVRLIEIEGAAGSHRAHIDPRGAAWAAAVDWLERAPRAAQAAAQ